MKNSVKFFLGRIGMMKYHDIFQAKGFDLESDVHHLTPEDLEDSLMISSPRDRAFILYHALQYKANPQIQLSDWLHLHDLGHYLESFVRSELVDLRRISQLQLPNEELYDELEIVMPGHRKRLERAVVKLRQEQSRSEEAELPITHGWWGKPKCLPQAKFDFLCVRAALFSNTERHNKVYVDFMVDSGSDVSTVQEDTLKQLNLDLLGSVYSCGIHGGNHTNLYRAKLALGTHEMEIEIMASNYDSLGSRVVRNFRHVIDGNKHIWLKGNYRDPLPAVLPLPAPASESSGQSSQSFDSRKALTRTEATIKSLDKPDLTSVNNIDISGTSSEQTDNPQVDVSITSNHQLSESGGFSVSVDPDLLEPITTLESTGKRKLSSLPVDMKRPKQSLTESEEEGSELNQGLSGGQPPTIRPFSYNPSSASALPSTSRLNGEDSAKNNSTDRVSLKNTIPSHLKDTDDDIDHMVPMQLVVNGQCREYIQTAVKSKQCDISNDVIHISCVPEEEDIVVDGYSLHTFDSSPATKHRNPRPDNIITLSLKELNNHH